MHRSHFANLINFVAMEICIVFIMFFIIISYKLNDYKCFFIIINNVFHY